MKIEDFHTLLSGREGAPWIIFLHGLLGAAANWRRILPAFESDYRVLALDQRGHGRSFKPSTGYSPEDFAADLGFVMDALGIPKADLVGHSMGGRNALSFAYLHPQRVKHLVIEDIGPAASLANGADLVRKLRAVPVPFREKREAKAYLLNEFRDPKMGQFLYNSITLDPQGRAVWSFDLKTIVEIIEKGRGQDRWHELEGLRVPTLVVRGEKSDELPPEEFERMKRANPLVKGIEIKGAGHWVHFEKPAEFVAALRNFLGPAA